MNYLNLHSCFSPMDGLATPEELIRRAKEEGAEIVALTDTNGLYGVPEFLKTAKEHEIKAAVGSEILHQDFHFTVLTRDRIGRRRALCFSKSHEARRDL